MKQIILVQFLFMCVWNCFSQSCNSTCFSVEKDSIQYAIETSKGNGKYFYGLLYTVHSISDDIIWLWLENKTDFSDDKKMTRYFFNNESGISFYHLLTDANVIVTDFCPVLFETFLKHIRPNKSFTIQILSDEPFSYQKKEDIFKYLDERIVVVSNEQLTEFLGIKDFINWKRIDFYKEDFIVLPISLISF
jgi:hypothetical protein